MTIFSNVDHPLRTGVGVTSDSHATTNNLLNTREGLELYIPLGKRKEEYGVFRANFGLFHQDDLNDEDGGNWISSNVAVDVVLQTYTQDLFVESTVGYGQLPMIKSGSDEVGYISFGIDAAVLWRPSLGKYQLKLGGRVSILKDIESKEGYGEADIRTELGVRRFFHLTDYSRIYTELEGAGGFVAASKEDFPFLRATLRLGLQHDFFG